ncbi:hypothetical protein [Microbacterium atlanticum]|uniref:hypothetical protein n=1 Tax=Microbacterium atlanticum TaxID=2782168 RepID=UPI001887274C|nr:hypothetical protein [Microbacterium atlanticum]
MLQIASGIYFDTDDLYETVHRRVVYTNGLRGRAEDVELPIGVLRFTNGYGDVQPVVVECVDRLERTDPDGSQSPHIATSGDELIDDFADVVAFGLDIVVLPDVDLAQRVVSGGGKGRRRRAKLLKHVLEPARYLSDEEITDLREFCSELIALERPHFEAAMRAIRRVADAVTFADSDVSLSYTLFVAAIESLAKDSVVPTATWEQYDSPKRKIIDAACAGLEEGETALIRDAVLKVDMLSLRRKFQGFVLEHLPAEYYRSGAANSISPIRAVDLPKALDFAYQVRSKTVHELRDLAPELRELARQDDTVRHDGKTVLSLEGLHRVCQHVIRQYIKRAPTGVDTDFQRRYRQAIPGIMWVPLSPEIWLPGWDSFNAKDAPRIFSALVESFRAVLSGESEGVIDARKPLEQIEKLLPGEAKQNRVPLVAAYALWHARVAEDLRRPQADHYLKPNMDLLRAPSMYSYALWAFGFTFDWTDAELMALADERESSMRQQPKYLLELPARLDAALRFDLAQRAWKRGDRSASRVQISKAIELLPGDELLLAHELRMGTEDVFEELDIRAFFLKGVERDDSEPSPDAGALSERDLDGTAE